MEAPQWNWPARLSTTPAEGHSSSCSPPQPDDPTGVKESAHGADTPRIAGLNRTLAMLLVITTTMLVVLEVAPPSTAHERKLSRIEMLEPKGLPTAPKQTMEVTSLQEAAGMDEGSEGRPVFTRATEENSLLWRLVKAKGTVAFLMTATIVTALWLMQAPAGNPGQGNGGRARTPPAWSPEREASYPFRHWAQDLLA